MFDLIPNTLNTGLTILFPTFAAYKALASPPAANPAAQIALLAPWLQYFTTISLLNTAEQYLWPLPSLVPFYAWLRLGAHIYLLLPGPGQGASFVWEQHIAPWIRHHESQIERVIEDCHAQARALGLGRLEDLWQILRQRVFGAPPPPPQQQRPAPSAGSSYVAGLLGRFAAPMTGAGGSGIQATDVLGLVGSALGNYASGSSSRSVIPDDVRGDKERKAWIAQQRQRLRGLLDEVESEGARLEKEGEYERIDRDEAREGPVHNRKSGTWGGWMFGEKEAAKSSSADLAYGDR